MIRFKLTVAYDGSNYAGWQLQKTGVSVQEVLEAGIRKLFPNAGRPHGSSRTDTGVHALGMVVHLDLPQSELRMTARKLPLALNTFLPPEIRIVDATRVPAHFHAQFDARGKQYRYFVWNAPAHNPLLRTQSWHVPRPLELNAMRTAARQFIGKRDFAAFATTRDYKMKSTVRTVTRCDFHKRGPLLTFTIEGDGFLYRMCRGIVGTLVQVGLGKYPATAIADMLDAKDRRAAGMTAPAHGLVLWKVQYGRSGKKKTHRSGLVR